MPRIVDHHERRREVGAAVCRAISERGFEGATVRAVAASSGWSTGVLSHYFDDKVDLLLHALATVGDAARRRMERAARRSPDQALRQVVYQALPLDDGRRIEWKVWLAFWGRAGRDARLAAEQGRLYRQWREGVRRLVARAQRSGHVSPELRAEDEAEALIAFIDGLGLQASLEPDRLTPHRQRRMVDRYLSRALGLGDSPSSA